MVSSSTPKEISDVIQASRDVVRVMVPPQLQSQISKYAKRLMLFLTLSEWGNLEHKYTVGDMFNVIIESNGNVELKKVE
jgi:hypothetical protein